MAWLKTIDGELVNLDSGIMVGRTSGEVRVCSLSNSETYTTACAGNTHENREYMKGLEIQLRDSGETIIDPS